MSQLQELLSSLSSTRNLKEALQTCLDSAIAISRMDSGGIYLADTESGSFYLRNHLGLSEKFVESVSFYEAHSNNARVIRSGIPLYLSHQDFEARHLSIELEEQLKAAAAIPIHHESEVIACLNIASHVFSDIPAKTRYALEMVASYIGSSIARLRTEDKLTQSETKYKSLVEKVGAGIASFDLEGRFIFVNRPLCEMIGRSENELINKPFWEFLHPEDQKNVLEIFNVTKFKLSQEMHLEYRVVHKHGHILWMYSHSTPLYDDNGHLKGASTIIQNITGRKLMEETLRESEKRYRLLADHAADVIWTADLNLRTTYISPSIEFQRGYTVEEAMQIPIEKILTPESYRISMETLQQELARENDADFDPRRSITIELEVYKRDGSTIWTENTISPIRDENRKMVEILGVTRDISDRKEAEKIINKQRDLGIALSSSQDLYEVLQLCLKTAIQLSGLDSGGIYLFDQETGELVLACSEGLSRQFIENASNYSADSPNVQFVMGGTPVYFSRQEFAHPLLNSEIFEGLQVVAVIPILHENKVIACMNVASHTMREIPPRERSVLETITTYIGSTITRLQIEKNLRTNEERFRSLVQNSTDIIIMLGSDMKITYVSPSVERVLGYRPEEVIGTPANEYFHPEDAQKIMVNFSRTLENPGSAIQAKSRVRKADGSWIYTEGTAINLLDNPAIQGVVINTKDVTDRRKSEEMLRNAAEQWRVTFDSMSDIIMVLGRDQRILRANQAAATLLGIDFKGLLGKKCYELIHDSQIPPEFCLHAHTLKDGSEHSREIYIGKFGKHFLVTTTPLLDENQEIIGLIHTMRDVTEQKKLEGRLRHAEKLAAIGGIAAGIAHEIKNPIFAISSGIQLLDSELNVNDEQRETLKILFNETLRVDGLIRQLVDYGTRSDLHRAKYDLNLLINEIVTLHRGMLKSKGIRIKTNIPSYFPQVFFDRNKITQVLLNLLQNAIDVSRRGGLIRIDVTTDDDRKNLIIRLRDQGPGIPEELESRIFDPFFTTKKKNLGMGLAICKKIVLDHGGDIMIEHHDGRGTTVRIDLSFVEDEDAEHSADS